MALVIEDGSIVAGANTYDDVAGVTAYAVLRGVVLSGDVEVKIIKSMDFIEGLRNYYKGSKTDPVTQALQWPRIDVQIDGLDFPENAIPVTLKSALAQLVIEQENGAVLSPTTTGSGIVKEKVDVIEIEYSDGAPSFGVASFPIVGSLLEQLFDPALSDDRAIRN